MQKPVSRRYALKLAAGLSVTTALCHAGLPMAFARTDSEAWNKIGGLRLPLAMAPQDLPLLGRVPEGLAGTLYRNGPAVPEGYNRVPQHRFDGDGFVHAFEFNLNKVTHRGKFVRTRKFADEQEFGDLFKPGFGSLWPESQAISNLDEINASNTNIVAHANRLMTLWEAGSAWEIDPQTLDALGPVKLQHDIEHLPFSAHPKLDSDGTLWNFGQIPWSGQMAIYHLDDREKLGNFRLLDLQHSGMIHDFAITERHLILVLPPLVWTKDKVAVGRTFLDGYEWRANQPADVFVIDKNSLEITRRHTLPPNFHFHTAAANDRDDGGIDLTLCQYEDAGILWSLMDTWYSASTARVEQTALPKLRTATLPATSGDGQIENLLTQSIEFPRAVNDHRKTRNQICWCVGVDEGTGLLQRIHAINLSSCELQSHGYGRDTYVDEHIFVPKPPAEAQSLDDGWLLGTHYNFTQNKSTLSVFNALHLSRGPIMTAALPHPMPPGLHGNFVPA